MIVFFPKFFLSLCIKGSLVLTVVSVVVLLILLWNDYQKGRIW